MSADLLSFDPVLKDRQWRGRAKMPATSVKQRRAMAIAEHHPSELYPENRGLLKMSKGQLHDFAATPEKNLPESKVKKSMKAVMRKKGKK